MSTSTPLGPRPTRTDRPGKAGLRVLRVLANSPKPATVTHLTAALGSHPNTVRGQLDRLVKAGFAEASQLPPRGRGRPSKAFTATTDGRQVAEQKEGLDDDHALLDAIADQLADSPDQHASARALGKAWGRRLTGHAGAALDLAALLSRQGFTPQQTPEGLRLLTCPFLDAVQRHPVLVCVIHQGVIDALCPQPTTLHPFAAPGACVLSTQDPHPT